VISVVTPSFRQLDWLQLCVASVADQVDVRVEHIVQDGGSNGFSENTLLQAVQRDDYHLRFFVEKDVGMYDAINRGLSRASGEICAYLNCDEQYLPGALGRVAAEFESNPTTDVLLAGSLVVDGDGNYHCSRPALKPRLRDLQIGLMYNLSSGIFFRSSLIRKGKHFFDPRLRIVGDRDWLLRVLAAGAQMQTVDYFTSIFSDLGTNLALSDLGEKEIRSVANAPHLFPTISSAYTTLSNRFRRLIAGHYRQRPFSYSIYTLKDPTHRRAFNVGRPTGIWRNRL